MASDADEPLSRLRVVAKEELRLLEVTNATVTTALQNMGQRATAGFAVYSAISAIGIGAGVPRLIDAYGRGAKPMLWLAASFVAISLIALTYAAIQLLTLLPPDVIDLPIPLEDYLRLRASVLNDPSLDPELETVRYSTVMFRRVVATNQGVLAQMSSRFRNARRSMGLSLGTMMLAFILGILAV